MFWLHFWRASVLYSLKTSLYQRRVTLTCVPFLSFVHFSAGMWSYLQGTLLRRYADENNGINVLAGPIFDYNYDGLRDTTEKITE